MVPKVDAQLLLRGLVRDAQSGVALPGANVQVEGGGLGTVTDGEGRFVLALDAWPVDLRVSFVGYLTQEVAVDSLAAAGLVVRLAPDPLEMEETLVQYEDPAARIMAEVIRRKKTWAPLVRHWQVQAHTRQTLYSGAYIAAMRQSVSQLFWQGRQGLRERVKAQTASANVPEDLLSFSAGAHLVDLYADQVELFDETFIGPTHPDGLAHFRFVLGHQEKRDGGTVYHISVQPRSETLRALAGSVTVLDGDFALVEARLGPNRRVPHPRIESQTGLAFSFEQRFAPFEAGVWLPTQLHYQIEGRVGTSALEEPLKQLRGVATPVARLRGITQLHHRQVNRAKSDFAFATSAPLVVEPAAATWTKLLDQVRTELPLNRAQERFLADVSGQSMAGLSAAALFRLYYRSVKKPPPLEIRRDPIAAKTAFNDNMVKALIAGSTGLVLDSTGVGFLAGKARLPIPRFMRGKTTAEGWANRVDGMHMGLRWKGPNTFADRVGLYAKGGYDTGPRTWFYGVGLRGLWGPGKRGYSGLSRQRGTVSRFERSRYTSSDNTWPFLLSLDDYLDFYARQEWRFESGWRFGRQKSVVELGFNWEEHQNLTKHTNFNLLCGFQSGGGYVYEYFCEDRDRPHRANPPIDAGRLRSVDFALDWGSEDPTAYRKAKLWAEYSDDWMDSDFKFVRLGLWADLHFGDWPAWPLAPVGSNFRLVAGGALGDLPIQRFGGLDGSLIGLSFLGTLRTLAHRPYVGEHYVGLFWEHFWRPRPGVRWALHGASGRTWMPARALARVGYEPRYTTSLHHELGVGLSLFNVRVVYLEATRRLDRADWRFGVGVRLGGFGP